MVDTSRRSLLRATATLAVVPGAVSACVQELADRQPSDDTDPVDDTDVVDTDVAGPDTGLPEPPLVEFDTHAIPIDDVVFDGPLQAGSMRKHRALLGVRVGWETTMLVRVWLPGDTPTSVRLEYEETVEIGPDGYTRAEAIGLTPGVRHTYAWFTLDGDGRIQTRSELGSFVTPPEDDVLAPFTVAIGACNGGATGRQDAMGRLADVPVDALLHLGDIVYADGAETLREYRSRWDEWMLSDGYMAGLRSTGWYATWDDHEVDNDWDPEDVGADQKAAAAQAFYENVAMEKGPEGQLWQSYRWGRTAEILVLDCRSERLPSTRGDTDTYISPAQMAWLKARLKQSDCVFKIVMNSVPITNMPPIWDLAANDRWEGYPKQRRELLDWIDDEDIADVWFVSGDFHVCFAATLERNGTGRVGKTWEIAVTSGNSNPLGLALQRPQFQYNTLSARLAVLRFDPIARAVQVRFIDPGSLEDDAVLNLSQGDNP